MSESHFEDPYSGICGNAIVFESDPRHESLPRILISQRTDKKSHAHGIRQVVQGGHNNPRTDACMRDTMRREIFEEVGLVIGGDIFVGTIGPWIREATASLSKDKFVLTTTKRWMNTGELPRPLVYTLFIAWPTNPHKLHRSSESAKLKWLSLKELIAIEGKNPSFRFWTMVYASLVVLRGQGKGECWGLNRPKQSISL